MLVLLLVCIFVLIYIYIYTCIYIYIYLLFLYLFEARNRYGDQHSVTNPLNAFPQTYFRFGRGFVDSSPEVDQLIREIIHDRIFLETDAPYMLPHPWALRSVVNRVALVRNLTPRMVRELAPLNAIRFFQLLYRDGLHPVIDRQRWFPPRYRPSEMVSTQLYTVRDGLHSVRDRQG